MTSKADQRGKREGSVVESRGEASKWHKLTCAVHT